MPFSCPISIPFLCRKQRMSALKPLTPDEKTAAFCNKNGGGRFSHHAGMTECCSFVGKQIWKEVLSVRESFIGNSFPWWPYALVDNRLYRKITSDYKKPAKPYPRVFCADYRHFPIRDFLLWVCRHRQIPLLTGSTGIHQNPPESGGCFLYSIECAYKLSCFPAVSVSE